MSQRSQSNGIVEGVIWKQILKFFFPIMLGTLFQQLYNTVDAAVVGRFCDASSLASVGGSAAQILDLITGFFVGLSSGATVIVSQFFGANEQDNVSKSVHTAVTVALICGALMTTLGLAFTPALLRLLKTPAEIIDLSALYLRVIFLAMIPAMLYNIGSGILRAVGDSRRPLYVLIICCVVNVALDLLFVIQFRMGVLGVAIATSIAQTVSAILVCAILYRAKASYRLELKRLRADRALMGRTVRIGLPTGLQSVMYAVANMIITVSINELGTNTVAAWVALGKVDSMHWMLVGAFGISVMTFVGQNYGARRYDRVRKSMRVCFAMAFALSGTFCLTFFLFHRPIFSIFTKDESVLEIASRLVMVFAPFYWLYVPIEIISGTLRGMGETFYPTIITALGICGLRVLWMLAVAARQHSIVLTSLSYPISWLLSSVAFILYYLWYKRTHFPKHEY